MATLAMFIVKLTQPLYLPKPVWLEVEIYHPCGDSEKIVAIFDARVAIVTKNFLFTLPKTNFVYQI